MQYTRYGEGQFYGWHNDAGLAGQYKPVGVGNRSDGLAEDFVNENIELVRKLSFTLQLSDPTDYDGGDMVILTNHERKVLSKTRGSITIFPSYLLHRVETITRGIRYSLVGWVSGPRFK